jgi:histone acetyltransferase (RNA polymerase elongator complex component)
MLNVCVCVCVYNDTYLIQICSIYYKIFMSNMLRLYPLIVVEKTKNRMAANGVYVK